MDKKRVLFSLATILIIASFLRLYNLMPADNSGAFSPPGLYPDEAMNGNNAVEAIASGDWKVFYPENFGREGLFINIQSLSIMALGNTPWALRLPSAIFGILTVLGLYLLTKAMFKDENPALFSSFLLATSFWHLMFSRIGFRAIMAPAFLVWGLFLLIMALEKFRIPSGLPEVKLARFPSALILGGAVFGLGMYSYIAYRTTPLIVILIGYLYWKNNFSARTEIIRSIAIFSVSALLVCLPLLAHFWSNPADFFGRTSGISVFNSESPLFDLGFNAVKTLGMLNVAGDFNWRHNFAGRPELFLPVGLFFLFGLWLSARKIIRERFSAVNEILIFGWLAVVILPVIISNEGLPHALRSILMIPPVFILSAIGGLKIYDALRSVIHPKALSAIGYAFCAVLVLEVSAVYFVAWSNHPAVKESFNYRDFILSRQISSLPEGSLKFVVVPGTDRNIERDYPISLQAVLFLTDTFSAGSRERKNIFYLPPNQASNLKVSNGAYLLSL